MRAPDWQSPDGSIQLKAPFPWFGGKSSIAEMVWSRFGDTPNYVEPFAGSAAMLLSRPADHTPRTETINDKDGFVANFWRAVQASPEAVADACDWPVNENDLHARHAWLVSQSGELRERLEGDPDFYDAKIAGWWVWGICSWIGSGWCSGKGPWRAVDGKLVKANAGRGINRKRPHLGAGRGINRKLPHLGNAGMGACEIWGKHLAETMKQLADRLRRVRVCSGDWSRVCGRAPTITLGLTAVFLDPPYMESRTDGLYAEDSLTVAEEVRQWAIENGDNPKLRIALCGYEGEHEMPTGWKCVAWKAHGGYGLIGQGAGRTNASRERVWFSPHCLKTKDELSRQPLFAVQEGPL